MPEPRKMMSEICEIVDEYNENYHRHPTKYLIRIRKVFEREVKQ